eukprot:scaffold23981_cov45-Cyclotella_meneghiniana.AAC.3
MAVSVSSADGNEATLNIDNNTGASGLYNRFKSMFTRRNSSSKKDTMIAPYQELIISQKVFHRSVNCLRFAVFVGAVAGTV